MRVDGIASIRCGEYEKHWTKMLADEGIAGFLPKLDIVIGDLSSMLSQLQQTNRNFVIECESRDDDIEDFYIGRILTIHDQFCEFANFDGLGPWDDEPHTIQPDDITRIQWDTPYANTFSRHLAGPCPFFETGEVGCSLELGGKIRGGGTARCGLVPPHSDECAYGGSLR